MSDPASTRSLAAPESAKIFSDSSEALSGFSGVTDEKPAIATRVFQTIQRIDPKRILDAGGGDGSVLGGTLKADYDLLRRSPRYVLVKEYEIENVLKELETLPAHFEALPDLVWEITNSYFSRISQRPQGTPRPRLEGKLNNNSSFRDRLFDPVLQKSLKLDWQAKDAVLLIYHEDHKSVRDRIIPPQGNPEANFDLIIASHSYRTNSEPEDKAGKVIVPLVDALGPGGVMVVVHPHTEGPAYKVAGEIWDFKLFPHTNEQLFDVVGRQLTGKGIKFEITPDLKPLPYSMISLPSDGEISAQAVQTIFETLAYAFQIANDQVQKALRSGVHEEPIRRLVSEHPDGKWFSNFVYEISRGLG